MPLPYNWYQGFRNDPAQTRREMDSDAIARNQVQRLPQQNRAQDLAIQGAEQGINQERRANAQKTAANYFSAIAQSQTPLRAAQSMLSNPNWTPLAQELGLNPAQFTLEGETDDTLRTKATDWARAFGGGAAQQGIARTWVNPETQTMWALGRDGQAFDTGASARQYADRYVNLGEGQGSAILNPGTGQMTPQVTPDQALAGTEATSTSESVGKALGEQYASLQQAVVPAQAKISRLDRMEQLLEGVDTGRFTPAAKGFAEVLDSFGITVDPNLPALQASQAIAGEMALQNRNPSGGAGMPGAMSDQDRQFLIAMGPNLAQTPEGRKLIMETARRLARRDMQIAQFARQYRQINNGKFDEYFYDALGSWSAENPLFQGLGAPPSAAPANREAPAGVDPELWQLMTPEQQDLWPR